MIAWLQRLIALSWLALLAAVGLWALRSGISAAVVLAFSVLVVGHAAVLALEFGWMHAANRRDVGGGPWATTRQLVLAWLRESLHAPRVFLWRQPFRAGAWADLLPDGTSMEPRRGILLLHGFVCNRGLWNPWLRRFHAGRQPFIALTLEPAFGSIDDYAVRIEEAVARLHRCTGMAPLVVAHSMGGLALRRWWAQPSHLDRIHHAVTIGTPHQGTRLARLAMSVNGQQMQESSAWLADLAALETADHGRRLTCFYSHCDNIVFPASRATVPGADNRHLDATPHVAMVDHPMVWAVVQALLSVRPALPGASDRVPCSRTRP